MDATVATRTRVNRHVPDERPLRPDEEPPLGAHLVSPRGFYLHHGVYVGGDRVIHYAGLSQGLRRGPVEEVSLERFSLGRGIRVRHAMSAHFDREQVITRARSRLGERRYHVFTNNCFQFCLWCLHGQPAFAPGSALDVLARWLSRRANPDRIPTVS